MIEHKPREGFTITIDAPAATPFHELADAFLGSACHWLHQWRDTCPEGSAEHKEIDDTLRDAKRVKRKVRSLG